MQVWIYPFELWQTPPTHLKHQELECPSVNDMKKENPVPSESRERIAESKANWLRVTEDWESLTLVSCTLYFAQWLWRLRFKANCVRLWLLDPHNNYFKNCRWGRKSTVPLASIVKWTCSSIQSWQRRPIMEMQQKTVPASDQWVSLFPCKDSAGASNMPLRSIAETMSCWQQNLYKNSSLSCGHVCWPYASNARPWAKTAQEFQQNYLATP